MFRSEDNLKNHWNCVKNILSGTTNEEEIIDSLSDKGFGLGYRSEKYVHIHLPRSALPKTLSESLYACSNQLKEIFSHD
jgi:hypothetical protein